MLLTGHSSYKTKSLRDFAVREGPLCGPSVKGRLHYGSGGLTVADTDGERGADLRQRGRHVRERDVAVHGRPVRPARDLADNVAVGDDTVAMTRDAAVHDQTGDPPRRSPRFRRRDGVPS